MGWLERLTNWFKEMLSALWEAFTTFMGDLLLSGLELVLDAFATAVEWIGVPDFMQEYSVGGALGHLPGGLQWMLVQFKIPEGLAVIALAWVFRLVRKLLTLGQW